MWELTKRISLRTSAVLSKVERNLHTDSDQKLPAPEHSLEIYDLFKVWNVVDLATFYLLNPDTRDLP